MAAMFMLVLAATVSACGFVWVCMRRGALWEKNKGLKNVNDNGVNNIVK